MNKAKRFYRARTFFRGLSIRLADTMLTGIELGKVPKVLTDINGILEKISEFESKDEDEFRPISIPDLGILGYYLWANEEMNFPGGKHPSFVELVDQAKYSTDNITRKVTLSIPQPLEDMLAFEGDVSNSLVDILSDALNRDVKKGH